MNLRTHRAAVEFDEQLAQLRQRLSSNSHGSSIRKIDDAGGDNVHGLSFVGFLSRQSVRPSSVLHTNHSDNAGGDDDPVKYINRALDTFVESTRDIEAFEYDESEEVERALRARQSEFIRGVSRPSELPRFLDNPFSWAPNEPVPTVAAHDTTTPPHRQVNGGSGAKSAAPRDDVEWTLSTRHQTATMTLSGDPYALPADVAARHVLRKDDPLLVPITGNHRRGRGVVSQPRPPVPAKPSTHLTNNSGGGESVKRRSLKPPAIAIVVDEGRVSFCRHCHRLIVGAGVGRCPHCGVTHNSEALVGEEERPDEGEVTSRAQTLVEDIEAEEGRLFQAAVAEWRAGRSQCSVLDSSAQAHDVPASEMPAVPQINTAFEAAARRIGSFAARRGQPLIYFSHLWSRAHRCDEQRQ